MVNFLSFDKQVVVGPSREEAFKGLSFDVVGDASGAYKKWREANPEADDMVFYCEYLEKKSKNAPGSGFYITLQSACPDTRERPYKLTHETSDVVRKLGRCYQLIDANTGAIVADCGNLKSNAERMAKDIITDGYKGDLKCVLTKQVIEGNPVIFTAKYTPSKNSHDGEWIVFGIKAY